MIEWLRDRQCNTIEIEQCDDPVVFSRKELQWFLSKKSFSTRRSRKKKKDFFRDLTTKLTENKVV